jgi:hypothetical protein
MENSADFGEGVANRLRSGSRDDYVLVQELVARAMKTQSWTYGDMIMGIMWALLPEEAQNAIARPLPRIREGGAVSPEVIAGETELPPPLPSGSR